MIRVYLSPRYTKPEGGTRNTLATIVMFPGKFEEIVNHTRRLGVCIVDASPATHDAIDANTDITAIGPRFADAEAFHDALNTLAVNIPNVGVLKTKLEDAGINTEWINASHTVRDVIRHAMRVFVVEQILRGEGKGNAIQFLLNNLDTQVSTVPVAARQQVSDWMAEKFINTEWISGTSTVRQVLDYIVLNLGIRQIRIGTEVF